MRYFLLVWLTIVTTFSCGSFAFGQEHYEETAILRQGYGLILQLQLDSARQLLDLSRAQDPDNLLVELIDSYIDFLRSFINEDEASLEAFRQAKTIRLDRLEQVEISSPYHKFAQAEIHLQWALARSKHKEYIRAGWDINRAFKLLKSCKQEYPSFILADKSLSVIHALVGSIKGFRGGLLRILTALNGSVEEGLQEISHAYKNTNDQSTLWYPEIVIIRSLLARHIELDLDHSLDLLKSLLPTQDKSPLLHFLLGSTAVKMGQNKDAIQYWTCETMPGQLPFYYMDFLKGKALMNMLDQAAKDFLLNYIDNHPGSHYQKEARQKMAWYALLIDNDKEAYKSWMKKCQDVGNADFGEDQQAQQEAEARQIPHLKLLKARLLFDGGEFDRAKLILEEIPEDYIHPDLQLEYYYRLGRILQVQGDTEAAILQYIEVIDRGRKDPRYFACNAALQTGDLLIELGRIVQAKYYYNTCLSIHPKEYSESLHQKAQIGLDKL